MLDWFTPESMQHHAEARRLARMFLISHLFGPFLGLTVTAYLYRLDPNPGRPFWIIVAAIAAFWAFPPALRWTGRFAVLALLSLQNLTFVVLFVSYHYGGLNSPFLAWLLTVPLLSFYYLGESRLQHLVLIILLADLAVFWTAAGADHAPSPVPPEALSQVGIVSGLCAGIYVTFMARYYARVVASQSELEREVRSHKATVARLAQAKQAAEAASYAKSEFLANMSHELRTPLNAIIGFSELMSRETFGPLGDARYQAYAEDVHDSAGHLLAIINDILEVAKAEAGKLELAEEAVDLGDVLGSVARLFAHRIAKAGLSLSVRLPPNLPHLRADSRKVGQVVMNLLSNAVKFTPAGGRIEISAAADPRHEFAIAVRDTGIGVAQVHLAKLTQPFFQVEGAFSRHHAGTGMGLTIVATLMRQHGGTVKFESELGKGTTVRVIFPPQRILAAGAAFTAWPAVFTAWPPDGP
ncbi:MAG TPA: HAMP domain-containing sensor histidine kinase [Stellaceae bacterium]|nr:HAMP domain-containing sensor histidine kinase [Stellaceae bacterium]